MKKPLLVLVIVASLLALPAPAAGDDGGGFILVGADAAYVDFTHSESCHVSVGLVSAKMVIYFNPFQIVRPHADLEVKLMGDCGDDVGVVGTVGEPRAGIVKLRSAFVDTIAVPLDSGLTAIVDLEWQAEGPIRRELVREPGMLAFHRTRDAVVDGTVTIKDGNATLFDVSSEDDGWAAVITHYTEIQY